ncbi:hypothetical protein CN947_12935 [Bacillus cereus]|nr:hypothetical protein CN947_12935 [Bacillus cereus]
MKYIYPYNLIEPTKEKLKLLAEAYKEFPSIFQNMTIPTDQDISSMMDIMYHVSFEKEESRFISAKIAFMEPNSSEYKSKRLTNNVEPIKFEKGIKFELNEIVRLSPAFNPKTSILVVCPECRINNESDSNKLVIWGVVYIGNEYENLMNGRANGASVPPLLFTLEVSEPGELIATVGSHTLYILKGGKLVKPSLKSLDVGIIGEHFKSITNELYNEVCKVLETDKYSDDDSDDRPYNLYFSTLKNILRIIEKKRHGGTVIMIPESLANTKELYDAVNIKYKIKSPQIWEDFIGLCKYKRLYFDVAFKNNKNIEEYEQQNNSNKRVDWAQKKIFEHEEFIASLSEVDGAVIINEKFEIIGFGAEIRLTNQGLSYVKNANEPDGNDTNNLPITSFGTRHRSAIRFCNAFDNSVAFVVSQDGKVKVIKQQGEFTYLWNNLDLKP